MKWVISQGFHPGSRWELKNDTAVLGKVFRCNPRYDVEAACFADPKVGVSFQTFKTMKEAAEWLVKKVTTGTGAL
jgi:hypothetical protein